MASENGWIQTTMGDVSEGLFDGPHATPKKTDDGPIFLGISALVDGRLDLSGVAHLSEKDFVKWTRRITPREDDIVFSYETRLGAVARIPHGLRCCLGRRMALIRPNKSKVDPRFLLYLYLSPAFQNEIRARTVHGSTVDRIPLLEFPKFPITLPPPGEQEVIAGILGALDDKIELNRRMNETLEAMARTIFKSWFVDFDPVRAKLDGRQPPGMDADTAALFPDHIEHMDGEPVPKGWAVRRWGDIATLEYGKSLRGYKDATGPYRVFGTNGPIGRHTETLCDGAGIIIGRKGAYRGVHYSPEPFFVIDTAFYLQPKFDLDLTWAYYELLNFDINSMDSGSAIPSTSRDDFYAIPVCVPSPDVLRAFGQTLTPLYSQKFANDRENETLGTMRDVLLPKLLSGEIRVVEAESFVGAVT